MIDYYQLLGISLIATDTEIKKACEQIRAFLPKLVRKADKLYFRDLEKLRRFIDFVEGTLLNPKSRRKYDLCLGEISCPKCGNFLQQFEPICPVCGQSILLNNEIVCPIHGPHQTGFDSCPFCVDENITIEMISCLIEETKSVNFETTGLTSFSGGHLPIDKYNNYHPVQANEMEMPVTIKRYGRIDYFSPLELEREYPLQIRLLLERHGRNLPIGARVKWATLQMASRYEEPLIRVIPSSGFIRISPPFRDIRVKKRNDVSVDFKLVPIKIPASNNCNLDIDFEYSGEVIQSECLNIRINETLNLGPIHIQQPLRKRLGYLAGAAATIDIGASLYQFITETGSLDLMNFSISVASILILVGIGLGLWSKVAKRMKANF